MTLQHYFSLLYSQAGLAQFLPEADRDPSLWRAALRCEQLGDALRDWQQQLSGGEFDPACKEMLQVGSSGVL